METIQPGEHLIKDTLTLHLNTQADSCIPLNGTFRSKSFYDLKNYIDFENDDSIEYVTMSMPYAVLCNSNYIFYEGNSNINITYGGTSYSYTVPYGNYTVNTFIAFLSNVVFPGGMTASFSNVTNQLTFSYTGGGLWGFQSGTTCDYNMGFSGSLLTTDPYITAPYVVDFLPINRYLIHCNVLSNGLNLTSNSRVSSCDIIASVPNNARLNSQIVYENVQTEYLVRSISNNGITITITNDNNQEINFNNMSSYFVLQFHIYRKSIMRPLRFASLIDTIQKTNRPKMPEGVVLEE
jgi:hypothetical protein